MTYITGSFLRRGVMKNIYNTCRSALAGFYAGPVSRSNWNLVMLVQLGGADGGELEYHSCPSTPGQTYFLNFLLICFNQAHAF